MGQIEAVLFWIALGLYSLGWLSLAAGLVFRKSAAGRIGLRVLLGGFGAHTASILARWILTGHGPVMRDFENAMAGGWVIAALSMFLAYRRDAFRVLPAAAVPVVLILLGYGLTQVTDLEPLSPALKTPWLYIHVAFAWISFGAFVAASCAALVFLVKNGRGARAGGEADDSALRLLDELQFRLIAYGFVAAAVMIASGSIWARLLWGSYWGWDPVETWSLASWLLYGLYIHVRVVFRWRWVRAAWFALFAVIPVIISFWGVGALMTSRHLFSIMDLLSR